MADATVSKIIEDVVESICDNYCKYPEQYAEADEEKMYEERCDKCPLNKLI